MAHRILSRNIFSEPDFPLKVFRVVDHRDGTYHSHEFTELVMILAGHGRHCLGDLEYPFAAGDIFVIQGDQEHRYADMAGVCLVNILFSSRRLRLPLSLLADLPGYHLLFSIEPGLRRQGEHPGHLHLGADRLAAAAALLTRLEDELAQRRPGYRFHAVARLMELIGFCARCHTPPADRGRPTWMALGEVLSFMERNLHRPITVAGLARVARTSASTLTRNFRKVLSRSPLDYLIQLRILRAADLLRRDDRTVTEVAFACGFNDSNYFARQFRRVTGESPRAYRQRRPAG
jgi:AraC-like DNA-binding protein